MRIGIVGLGLIGGSLAGALVEAGHDVHGHDRLADAEQTALRRGLISEAVSLEALSKRSEVVFLCGPISAIMSTASTVAGLMSPGAILTDVGSVKRPIVSAMEQNAGQVRCIGGHPMAGKQVGGARWADPRLFQGTAYALVETGSTDGSCLRTMMGLVRQIGADPVEVDAETHDAVVAFTSHLPQLISSALSLTLDGRATRGLTGPGLRGMMRLAGSDEDLWGEIFAENADEIGPAIDDFIDVLRRLAGAMAQGDQTTLAKLMATARKVAS